MRSLRPFRWGLAALAGLAGLAAAADCVPAVHQRYFVLIFGGETRPKLPRYTHTWGTLVRATPCGPTPGSYALEVHTISWLPASLEIRPWVLRAEPGVNLDLHTTIRYCLANGEVVSLWGPYEVIPPYGERIYARAMEQVARLESGRVLYKAIDPDIGRRHENISDCIHAITDIDVYTRRTYYSEWLRFGDDASQFIVTNLVERGRIDPCVTHPWVASALGLDAYPIVRRPHDPPMLESFFARVAARRAERREQRFGTASLYPALP
ncbi:MAG TPA: hypothetical protein VIL46_09740 [Gemmataceae bacterium]